MIRRILLATCLAAVPLASASADDTRPPPPQRHGPPPEAIQACRTKVEHDACSFQLGDRTLEGTCAKGPDASKPLACRPANLPPRE